jgi:hypothetical protein
MKLLQPICLGALAWTALCAPASAQRDSDADVRKTMIQESIASYRGTCPCPYNRAANGSSCGKRSAYSRPGGASPLCYPDDISQPMIDQYRRQHGLPR